MTSILFLSTAGLMSACSLDDAVRLKSDGSTQRLADPVVELDSGEIAGTATAESEAFLGIPYAKAPIGDLRWRSPEPVEAWDEARDAKEFGSDCMQKPYKEDPAPLTTTPSEDCLFINVWRPAETRSVAGLPVMVWIHGGGFVNGGTSSAVVDGAQFAKQGVILVSFNYRLGRFGFFAHPALSKADEGPLGNYGFQDQLEALRWVQRNIRNFGGDPEKVTVFGESAGGASVVQWLTSKESEGLFQQAAVLSGGGRDFILGGLPLHEDDPLTFDAEKAGLGFAVSKGITGKDQNALTSLRKLPADEVVGDLDFRKIVESLGEPNLTYAGGPIIDGETVVSLPQDAFEKGRFARVPLIIGTTSLDIGVSPAKSKDALFDTFGDEADAAREFYDPDGTKTLLQLIIEVGVDRMMHEPAIFVATKYSEAGTPSYVYRFGYVAETQRPAIPGAVHASEVPFLFNTLSARFPDDVSGQDQETADAMQGYFVSFAQSGTPEVEGQPAWEQFDPEADEILQFTMDKGVIFAVDPWKDRLDLVSRHNDL